MPSLDALSPTFILEAVNQFPRDQRLIGLEILPPQEVFSYDVMFDTFVRQVRLAGIYGIDEEVQPGHKRITRRQAAELVRIQASRLVREEELLILMDTTLANVTETSKTARSLRANADRVIADDLRDIRQEIDYTIEWLCVGALQGKVDWPPPTTNPNVDAVGRANFTLDYGLNPNWNGGPISALSGGAGVAWSNVANANIVKDLIALKELSEEEIGLNWESALMICSSKVEGYLFQNAAMRDIVKNTSSRINSVRDMRGFLETEFGITIKPYGAKYSTSTMPTSDPQNAETTVQWHRFLPANKVIIIPDYAEGEVGNFLTGPAWANDFNPGWYAWSEMSTLPPYKMNIGAGYNGIPILKHPEAVMVFDVSA